MEVETTYTFPYRLLCEWLEAPPFITESYKLLPSATRNNRYFIHLDETARPLVKQQLPELASELQMPEQAVATLHEKASALDVTFIGVDEDNGTCTYRLYLGFATLMEPEAGKEAYSIEWVPEQPAYRVKEYHYEKETTESEALDRARQCLAPSIYNRDPGGEKLYDLCLEMIRQTHFTSNFLSVKQQDAARQSVYFSLVENEPLPFKEVHLLISLMAALLDIPADAMHTINSLCRGAVLEHVGIGTDNSLMPFVTLYRNPVSTSPVYDTGTHTPACSSGCNILHPSESITSQTFNTIIMENQESTFHAAETLPAMPSTELTNAVTPSSAETPAVTPSCSCQQGNGSGSSSATGRNKGELVFALGSIGYQFGNESIRRSVEGEVGPVTGNPDAFLKALLGNDSDSGIGNRSRLYLADSVLWTFNLDGFPIYAIRPEGNFARETYESLIRYMLYSNSVQTSVNDSGFINAVRCTMAGTTNGTVKLMNGMEVPVVTPDLRGLFCWTIDAMIQELTGPASKAKTAADKDAYNGVVNGILNFMERVYYSLRNTGKTAQDRAINYAVTNAFLVHKIFLQSYQQKLALKNITAQKSVFGLPGADCYDVVLTFFNPMNQLGEANSIYTFTVDVSSSVPSLVGPVRSWKA